MSDQTANKQLWQREKRRLRMLAPLLNSVNESDELNWVIDSVDDRMTTLWNVEKSELYRTMYVFMIAKMKRQIFNLERQVKGLRDEVDELKMKITN